MRIETIEQLFLSMALPAAKAKSVLYNPRMSDSELKAGDVVTLKSGGPKMTIEGIGQYGLGATTERANCVWFEGSKRMEHVFELVTLSKAS